MACNTYQHYMAECEVEILFKNEYPSSPINAQVL